MGDDQRPVLQLDPQLRRVALLIGWMIVAGGCIAALVLVWPVVSTIVGALSPFIVALVIAYLFNPIVNVAERRFHLTRVGGVVIVNLLLLLIVGIFVAIVVPILTTQISSAYKGIGTTASEKVIPWVNGKVMGSEAALAPETAKSLDEWLGEWSKDYSADIVFSDETVRMAFGQWAAQADDVSDEEKRKVDARLNAWLQRSSGSSVSIGGMAERRGMWLEEGESGRVSADMLLVRIDSFLQNRGVDLEELGQKALASSSVRSAATSAASEGAGIVGKAVAWVASFVGSLVGSVVFLVFVVLVGFYLLVDFGSFRAVAEVMVPEKHQARFFDVTAKTDAAVGGFIRGQVTSAVLVGLLTFLGLFALGMKQYALLIGCIAGVGNLIPYLGPIIGATPAVLYMILSDTHDGAQAKLVYSGLVVGLFAIIQAIDGFVFQPKIVGKSAQLHPVAVMVALVLGAQFGFVGMIVAVPAACIVRVMAKEFYWDRREESWRKRTGGKSLGDPPPRKARKRKNPAPKKDAS